jgi:hypothetical protein
MFFSRGPNRVQNVCGIEELYSYYVSNSVTPIDKKTFKNIISDYSKSVMREILEGRLVKLPSKLGYLSIIKRPIDISNYKHLPMDWENTVKYKKHVRHLNEHSNGFRFNFYWDRRSQISTNVNIQLYRFLATRSNKREMARLIKKEKKDYIQYGL